MHYRKSPLFEDMFAVTSGEEGVGGGSALVDGEGSGREECICELNCCVTMYLWTELLCNNVSVDCTSPHSADCPTATWWEFEQISLHTFMRCHIAVCILLTRFVFLYLNFISLIKKYMRSTTLQDRLIWLSTIICIEYAFWHIRN